MRAGILQRLKRFCADRRGGPNSERSGKKFMPSANHKRTVKALLPDINVKGHLKRLIHLLNAGEWHEFWKMVQLPIGSFDEYGLQETDADARVWQVCQVEQLI